MFDSAYAQWALAMAPWIPAATVAAIVLVPVGMVLMAWSGRRRMYRRNFAGVQEFRSYGHAVGATALEGIVSWLGSLLMLVGLLAAGFAGFAVYLQRFLKGA